ncbi:hypothetical protein HDE_09073 [Halotydeus destructor]|nr:hypothetical protein HDE_09073 [Halotydeus destructor]
MKLGLVALVLVVVAATEAMVRPSMVNYDLESCCCETDKFRDEPVTLALSPERAYAMTMSSRYCNLKRNTKFYCNFRVVYRRSEADVATFGFTSRINGQADGGATCPQVTNYKDKTPTGSGRDVCPSLDAQVLPGEKADGGADGFGFKFEIPENSTLNFNASFTLVGKASSATTCAFRDKMQDEVYHCPGGSGCVVVETKCNGISDCPTAAGGGASSRQSNGADEASCPLPRTRKPLFQPAAPRAAEAEVGGVPLQPAQGGAGRPLDQGDQPRMLDKFKSFRREADDMLGELDTWKEWAKRWWQYIVFALFLALFLTTSCHWLACRQCRRWKEGDQERSSGASSLGDIASDLCGCLCGLLSILDPAADDKRKEYVKNSHGYLNKVRKEIKNNKQDEADRLRQEQAERRAARRANAAATDAPAEPAPPAATADAASQPPPV